MYIQHSCLQHLDSNGELNNHKQTVIALEYYQGHSNSKEPSHFNSKANPESTTRHGDIVLRLLRQRYPDTW